LQSSLEIQFNGATNNGVELGLRSPEFKGTMAIYDVDHDTMFNIGLYVSDIAMIERDTVLYEDTIKWHDP
jgi:hypothetical protein